MLTAIFELLCLSITTNRKYFETEEINIRSKKSSYISSSVIKRTEIVAIYLPPLEMFDK